MIGKWMETLRDVELQRIADAPQMVFGMYGMGEDRCLGNVAFESFGCSVLDSRGIHRVVIRYDDLCRKVQFGTWRSPCPITLHTPRGWRRPIKTGLAPQPVLTMLRNRARRILARRTLNALTPECGAARLLVGP